MSAEDSTYSGSWDAEHITYLVYAPAGKLGMVLDNRDDDMGPLVCTIKENSPLMDRMDVGDRLMAVDEIDVRAMNSTNISKLISKRSRNPVRKFTMVKNSGTAPVNEGTTITVKVQESLSRDPPELTTL